MMYFTVFKKLKERIKRLQVIAKNAGRGSHPLREQANGRQAVILLTNRKTQIKNLLRDLVLEHLFLFSQHNFPFKNCLFPNPERLSFMWHYLSYQWGACDSDHLIKVFPLVWPQWLIQGCQRLHASPVRAALCFCWNSQGRGGILLHVNE